jgi:hypothetical protein
MIGDSRVRRWCRPRFGERAIDLEGERLGRGRARGRKVIERGATGLVIGRARTGPRHGDGSASPIMPASTRRAHPVRTLRPPLSAPGRGRGWGAGREPYKPPSRVGRRVPSGRMGVGALRENAYALDTEK